MNYPAENTLLLNLSSLQGKTALVTGASSGIGWATACILASLGCHLNITARREERLQQLKQKLIRSYPDLQISFLSGDIREKDTLERMRDASFFNAEILINNAGSALGRETVNEGKLDEWEAMIDINIRAAFAIAHYSLPYMLKKGEGDVVCLSSIAAHIAYEGGSIYCATKHALRAFCTALRQETCGTNVRIIQVSPGMVETEFSQVRFRGDQEKAGAIYAGMTPLSADDVARQIAWALLQPRHVNLDEILMTASAQGGVGKVVRNNT